MGPCKHFFLQLPVLLVLCKFLLQLIPRSLSASPHILVTWVSKIVDFLHLRTPGIVASFVLREPDQVDASGDKRELTPLGLYVPVLTAMILVGLAYQRHKEKKTAQEAAEKEQAIGESTPLINRDGRYYSEAGMVQRLRASTEIHRRHSVTIMGIPVGETHNEQIERKSVAGMVGELLEDDEDLQNLDF